MKLNELYAVVDRLMRAPRAENNDVMIRMSDPSIGPIAMTAVKHIANGFDWENRKTIITPEQDIYYHSDEETIRRLRKELDKLAYEVVSLRTQLSKANK